MSKTTTRPPSRKKVRSKGTLVWVRSWDNGMMAGLDEMFQLDGKFYYQNDNYDDLGPFETLDEALEETGLECVNSTTRTIDSPFLKARQVVKYLRPDEDDRDDVGFEVNGEVWYYDKAKGFTTDPPKE